jgi:hypothetical protein
LRLLKSAFWTETIALSYLILSSYETAAAVRRKGEPDMNSVLTEIYSTVLSGAPYVIAAYVGIIIVLAIFVIVIYRKLLSVEKQVAALEEAYPLSDDDA